jgi:integrase
MKVTNNGKGAFRRCEDGTWMIDTKIKIENEFKHFTKRGYPTLSSAKADFERAKAEFVKKKTFNSKITFLQELIAEYLKMRKRTVNESTVEQDNYLLNKYLLSYFDNDLISNVITDDNFKMWFDDLVNNPDVSPKRQNKVITTIKSFLNFAYMHKFISASVYQDCDVCLYKVKASKKSDKERVIWSPEEEKSFIQSLDDDKISLMFRTFIIVATRLGEFLGIQGKCFDYANSRINICQQVKNKVGEGAFLTGKLKTSDSYRTILIPKELNEELNDYITQLGIKDDDFLWFSSDKKKPYSRTHIRKLFNYYCDKANVRRMNLHALRHNQAVKLARICTTGEEIEIVARRLGHSPEVFMNIYANHHNQEKETELLSKLNF